MGFVFDSTKKGLETVMRDYQLKALRFLWERGEEGTISKDIWLHVNKILLEEDSSISRASIINSMNAMVDKGILKYFEETGKGGYHRVYSPIFDEAGLKEYIARHIIEKLLKEFPAETDDAIRKIMDKT